MPVSARQNRQRSISNLLSRRMKSDSQRSEGLWDERARLGSALDTSVPRHLRKRDDNAASAAFKRRAEPST